MLFDKLRRTMEIVAFLDELDGWDNVFWWRGQEDMQWLVREEIYRVWATEEDQVRAFLVALHEEEAERGRGEICTDGSESA